MQGNFRDCLFASGSGGVENIPTSEQPTCSETFERSPCGIQDDTEMGRKKFLERVINTIDRQQPGRDFEELMRYCLSVLGL